MMLYSATDFGGLLIDGLGDRNMDRMHLFTENNQQRLFRNFTGDQTKFQEQNIFLSFMRQNFI